MPSTRTRNSSKESSAMNNIFSFKRFGRYFTHDLASARNNFGLTLLVAGLLPVIVWFFNQVFHRIFSGSWASESASYQITAFLTSYFIVMLSFPVRAYGSLTERAAGSQWILLPASNFEKWLSMVLMSCVVVPVVWTVLLLGSDALLSLIPDYGKPVAYYLFNINDLIADGESPLQINALYILGISWCCNVLVWLLGAIRFKRGKVAKTFLAVMALGFVLCILSVAFFGGVHIEIDELVNDDDPENIISKFNLIVNCISWTWICIFLALTYLRVRTIKH